MLGSNPLDFTNYCTGFESIEPDKACDLNKFYWTTSKHT